MLYHNVMVMAHYQRVLDSAMIGLVAVGLWAGGVHAGRIDGGATWQPLLAFSVCLGLSFLWLSTKFHVYQARRTEHIHLELKALFEVLVYATGVSCLVAQMAGGGLPGALYAGSLLVAAVLLLGVHAFMRLVIRQIRRKGQDHRAWLLVGRNERSASIAEGILANPHFGVRVARIVDFEKDADADREERLRPFQQLPLAAIPQGETTDTTVVREIIENEIIDEVVVTLPLRSFYDEVQQVLGLCGEAGISVKFSPDVFDQSGTKVELSHVGSVPMVTHFTGPSDPAQLMVKRAIDVIAAAAALLLLSPLLAAVAAWIKLRSPGPVLFVQTRLGLHGRPFQMVKFRTMREDADALREQYLALNQRDEVAFKIKDDPRIAPGGQVLRRYHLDELPQLWNVLIGDMSLVGPRALPPGEAPGREWWQRRRLSMPPGMTCFWQAAGDPTIPFRKWMELDLEYIDHWSIWLDLRLILETLVRLPRGSGW
jgi:exopolysaccharide biosynthesis polyprenyl glycosylphosphotransferase